MFWHELTLYILPIILLNFIIGIVSWPFCHLFFKKLGDKGYAISHVLGLFFVSYIYFAAVNYANKLGFSEIVRLHQSTLYVIFSLWIVINVGILIATKPKVSKESLKELCKILFLSQFRFWIFFLLFYFIKARNPQIYESENFMDFGILRSLQNAKTLPVFDFWLNGYTLNYYYFGHFISYVFLNLTNISFIPGVLLTTVYIFALTAENIYAFGREVCVKYLSRIQLYKTLAGILSVYFVLLATNFYGIAWFIKQTFNALTHKAIYGFPDGITFGYIYNTNTEMPFESFMVENMHAHVWSLLSYTVILMVLFYLWTEKGATVVKYLLGFIVGIAWLLNGWDIFSVALFISLFLLISKKPKELITTVILAGIVYLPFMLSFKSPLMGIGVVRDNSPFDRWFIYWGAFISIIVAFIYSYRRRLKEFSFLLVVILFSAFLIAFPEVLFFKDRLVINEYYRFNTVFKLYYPAWIILGLVAGPLITSLMLLKVNTLAKKFINVAFIIFIISSVSIFSLVIIFTSSNTYTGIATGFKWFEQKYPYDYEAVQFLQKQNTGPKVLFEASDEYPYHDSNIYSMYLGWSSVIGWANHENVWRNEDPIIFDRLKDNYSFYSGTNLEEAKQILIKYKPDYIILGQLEKRLFGDKLQSEKILKLGKVVFENAQTKILVPNL